MVPFKTKKEQISALVIEDEPHVRKILEYNLPKDGFEVLSAGSGEDGIEAARRYKPDVILLDWMMPGMDGMQALSRLKENEQTRDIPVFMLTARNMEDNLSKAFEKGAADYIVKPFDPRELGQRIRRMLEVIGSGKI